MLPFVTWAIIKYFLAHPDGYNLATWLLHVVQVPDEGLWFLWVLFQCSCALALVSMAVQYLVHCLTATSDNGRNSAVLYIILIVAWPIANALFRALPSDFGLGMAKGFFPYFFAGFIFHVIRPNGLPKTIRWIPYVIFIALAPFWYRTEVSPVALLFPHAGSANLELQRIVAVAGTLAFVDLVHLFVDKAPAFLAQPAAYSGKRSLDIYAIHFYFLGYFPPVIAPIAASLGVSLLLRTNFVTSWLCLGQKPLKTWPMSWDGFSPADSGMTKSAIAAPKE